jgi:hypothetical protein
LAIGFGSWLGERWLVALAYSGTSPIERRVSGESFGFMDSLVGNEAREVYVGGIHGGLGVEVGCVEVGANAGSI